MIVPVKKLKLVVLKEDEEKVLKTLQRLGEVMVISSDNTHELIDSTAEDLLVQRSAKSLSVIKPFKEKEGMLAKFSNQIVVDYSEFANPDYKVPEEKIEQIEKADEIISHLKGENDALNEFKKSLTPWAGLEGKLSTVFSSKYTRIHCGFVPLKNVEQFKEAAKEFEVQYLGTTSDSQAVLIANWYEEDEAVMDSIKTTGFMEVTLPNVDQSINELIREKDDKISSNIKMIAEQEALLKNWAKEEKDIQIFQDEVSNVRAYKRAQVQETVETVYLEGWIKENKQKKVLDAIAKVTENYDYEICDPEENEVVPVALENNKFAENFEPITDMFDHPSHDDLDPNPVMSIWYWVIFGLMMADAGYGFVLAAGSFALLKIMKPRGGFAKLIKVFFLGSITTMIWGILFGSYFGAELLPHIWFVPQEDPITMLLFSLILGVVHLSNGLIMKCYMEFKNGHPLDGIFDNISWVLVLVGGSMALAQFCANMLPGQPTVPSIIMSIGYIVAGLGLLIILCTAGRHAKNPVMKVAGGLKGVYNITSYLSDVLSYARILALAMSSAIIGYVMNLLASMVGGAIPVVGIVLQIIVYIIGHVFNLVMGLLSAYVHASRLQYIEFYGKFYGGGGKQFTPLSLEYKFINQVQDTANN